MSKVDGWVFNKPEGAPAISSPVKMTVFQLLIGDQRYTPVFMSMEKGLEFATGLQRNGIPMEPYQLSFASGIEDKGDLIIDPRVDELMRHPFRDIRPEVGTD